MGASQNDDTTSEADAERIVAMARDGGVNFIDTADEYTLGESERVVGQVIAGERDHWMLATKACNQLAEYLAALEFEPDTGDEALIDGLVAIGHLLKPGYSYPEYSIEGRVPNHRDAMSHHDEKGIRAMTETMLAFRNIVERLRSDTGASRTTIRVDCAPLNLDVETVAAESRDDGVRALEGQQTPGVRTGAAARWLLENRRPFVMADCLNPWAPEVAPEKYVIDLYGIRAEMVCGVFRDDDMVCIVSVHHTKGARAWSAAEVAMIQHACDAVGAILDAIEDV